MKKRCSSVVWRFFDRIEDENQRCLAVLCKLCDTQYKFFGNTTNLRSHLLNKHRLQWELSQSDSFEETDFRVDDESNQSAVSTKRRKYSKGYKDKNVDVLDISNVDTDQNEAEESEATFNLVKQLHDTRDSDEQWLEHKPHYTNHVTFESKPKKKFRKIKRETQSPPPTRRVSTYNPQTISYENASPIIIEQPNHSKDEYSVFGEYIANKLRKFTVPRTRGNLQQLITTILWQAEYGAYDNADSVKRVLMFMTQEADNTKDLEIQNQNNSDLHLKDQEENQSIETETIVEIQ